MKFFGDENAASVPDQAALEQMTEAERRVSFAHQNVARRAAIVVAGPLANFLLAIVIFAGLFMIYGKQSTAARVDSVQPDSAAAAAGFQPSDLVLTDRRPGGRGFSDMQRIVSTSAGETLTICGRARGLLVTLKAMPALKEVKDSFGNVHRIGVLGISRCWRPTTSSFEAGALPLKVWSRGARDMVRDRSDHECYIGRVVAGRQSADQLGGRFGSAQVSGQASRGFSPDASRRGAVGVDWPF